MATLPLASGFSRSSWARFRTGSREQGAEHRDKCSGLLARAGRWWLLGLARWVSCKCRAQRIGQHLASADVWLSLLLDSNLMGPSLASQRAASSSAHHQPGGPCRMHPLLLRLRLLWTSQKACVLPPAATPILRAAVSAASRGLRHERLPQGGRQTPADVDRTRWDQTRLSARCPAEPIPDGGSNAPPVLDAKLTYKGPKLSRAPHQPAC